MLKVIHLSMFIFIIMPRTNKVKQIEPSLQPWHHEQENNNMIQTSQLIRSAFNPEVNRESIQFLPGQRMTPALNRFNQSISRNAFSRQQSRNGNSNKRCSNVDFVKKNQQNLKSYHCMSQNYSSLLNDDLDNFMPLNPSLALNHYLKRPTINTTYIGYYDQEPFFIENQTRPRTRKQAKKSKSIETRPRTSDTTTIFYQNEMRRSEEKQMENSFCDRATLSVGGYHLQKMLKIKQKLRQKLKRNSEKKDIERGLYVKSSMKIQQPRNNSMEHNNSFVHAKTPSQSRKSSKLIQNGQKQKVRIDKWKQYMKLKNENNKANINNQNKQKTNKFFAVLGGAIYK